MMITLKQYHKAKENLEKNVKIVRKYIDQEFELVQKKQREHEKNCDKIIE